MATSSSEAEYIASCLAAKEAVFLRKMHADLRRPRKALVISIDNISSLRLIGNPIHHELTEHIRVQYHCVRELVATTKNYLRTPLQTDRGR